MEGVLKKGEGGLKKGEEEGFFKRREERVFFLKKRKEEGEGLNKGRRRGFEKGEVV